MSSLRQFKGQTNAPLVDIFLIKNTVRPLFSNLKKNLEVEVTGEDITHHYVDHIKELNPVTVIWKDSGNTCSDRQ